MKNNTNNLGCLVLNYNDFETTEAFLNMVNSYTVFKHILVVDNHSSDDSFNRLIKYQNQRIDVIQTDRNGGYGYGNNYGIRFLWNHYHCDYIVLANPDTFFSEMVIHQLLERFNQDDIAIVAPLTLTSEGKPQKPIAWKCPSKKDILIVSSLILDHLFRPLPYPKGFYENQKECFVDCVQGSFFLFNTEIMLKYGMYDENVFLFYEETFLGYRLKKAGFKTKLCLDLSYTHQHSKSIEKSINSLFSQRKIAMNSLLTYALTYLDFSYFQKKILKIYMKICLLENKGVLILFQRYNKKNYK